MEPLSTRDQESFFHRWRYMLRLFKLITVTAPKDMLVVMTITIVLGLVPLLSLFALQQLVNSVTSLVGGIETGTLMIVYLWMALFVTALLLQNVGNIFGGMLRDRIQERIKVNLQRTVIRKTHTLSLMMFETPELYDQLKRANNGVESRFFSTTTFVFQSVTNMITIVSLLIYLAFIHWSIPLTLFIGCLIFTFIQVTFMNKIYILDREQTTGMRKLGYLEGLLTSRQAAREIRLFGLGHYFLENWKRLNKELRAERLELKREEGKVNLISSTGNTFTFAVVLTGIVFFSTLGMLSVGQYAAFLRAVIEFQGVLFMLFVNTALIHNDLNYVKDFFDYLDLPGENLNGAPMAKREMVEGIKCERLGFTYPGAKKPVLSAMDLHIRPGERIALVGHNGSGKTTLIKLILGLYKPTDGRVTVDGMDLQAVDVSSWRRKCTAIFQDFHKYHLTVKDNIAVGQIEKIGDDEQIKKAAESSGADEMIRQLAAGYDTFLGKEFDGTELSQGQWQKIAIARAYVRDAELLILDEPTAALDPQAEVNIYKQFQEVAEGKTTIFISHRLGICKLADRIIVLRNGEIAEQGTHGQLLKENGHYAEMYRLQSQWYA